MEYRSRRERRDAERAGSESAEVTPESNNQSATVYSPEEAESASTDQKTFPSRRELRDRALGRDGNEELANLELEDENILETSSAGDSSQSRPNSITKQIVPEVEIQVANEPVTAKSYLYQESSNTFSMDSIPDSLTATNGDLVVTNSESIAVITGNHPSLSSMMEDLKYDSADHRDTVAGKISLVDPVSAKLVAESREPEVVVPGRLVVRNRALSVTFACIGVVMFALAGIGLWWAMSEMGPFSL